MPAYRFSWEPFSDRTLAGLARALGFSGYMPTAAREWLASRYQRPTDDFIRDTKDALTVYWLPEYRGAAALVERLMAAGVAGAARLSATFCPGRQDKARFCVAIPSRTRGL